MTNILIVEDFATMQEAIFTAFTATGRYSIVGTTPTASQSVPLCRQLSPDLVLMDVCTQGGASGLVATRQVKEQFPGIKVLIMTAFSDLSYIPRAKRAGADGFFYKSSTFASFIWTADRIMAGGTYFPPPCVPSLTGGDLPFSEREIEVLRLVCKHLSNKEIAEELCISESTVRYHKGNLLAKTGFSKSSDLAFYMISHGWINPLY